MKKIAALSLALIAGAASASTITIQTGQIAVPIGSSATAAQYKSDVDASVSVNTPVSVSSYDNLPISMDNGALKANITFEAATTGTWSFRAGVDFGYGGAMFLDGVAVALNDNNMWWNYSYSDPSQFLAYSTSLSAGTHTLTLYGMEDCCSGNQQTQYSFDSGAFTSFSNTDNLSVSAVPEAPGYAMLLAGLGLVTTMVRRRKQA